jgi:hypothetical protein
MHHYRRETSNVQIVPLVAATLKGTVPPLHVVAKEGDNELDRVERPPVMN